MSQVKMIRDGKELWIPPDGAWQEYYEQQGWEPAPEEEENPDE